jgi:aminoglycoside 3-N-acetyltransferase
MLGAPLDSITSLHLAEYRVPEDRKKPIQWAACILEGGKRVWTHYDDIENECADFPQIFQAFMDEKRPFCQGKVGNADCYLVSQPELVDFGVEWMIRNRK